MGVTLRTQSGYDVYITTSEVETLLRHVSNVCKAADPAESIAQLQTWLRDLAIDNELTSIEELLCGL
jgi:hypothetical protein